MKNIRAESNKKSKILSSFIIYYYFFAPDYLQFLHGPPVHSKDTVQSFYPAVRMGSSNTRFFFVLCFFSWPLSPDSWVSLSQIDRKLTLHYLAARVLSDRNIYCTLREGKQQRGKMPPGLFLLPLIKYLRQAE